jgi:hypothetical protein
MPYGWRKRVRRERGRGFDEFFVGPGAVLMETLED